MLMEDEIRLTASYNKECNQRIRKLKTIEHNESFLYKCDDYSNDVYSPIKLECDFAVKTKVQKRVQRNTPFTKVLRGYRIV
jgi:hypothetical protein